MARTTALENAEYIQKFLESLLTGRLCRSGRGRVDVRYLSDYRSLYDTLVKEGIPRIPSDKRLAIDLAAIRQDLKSGGRVAWLPTTLQLADMMTKPLKADRW